MTTAKTETKTADKKATFHVTDEAKRIARIKELLSEIKASKVSVHSALNSIGQQLSMVRAEIVDNKAFGTWRTKHFPKMAKEYASGYMYCYDNSSKIKAWMKAKPEKFDLTSPRSIQRQHKLYLNPKPTETETDEKESGETKESKERSNLLNSLENRSEKEKLEAIEKILESMKVDKTGNKAAYTDKTAYITKITRGLAKIAK